MDSPVGGFTDGGFTDFGEFTEVVKVCVIGEMRFLRYGTKFLRNEEFFEERGMFLKNEERGTGFLDKKDLNS